ncbi:MAG TPA: PHP domain-containing protein [Planctomycetota bacterium]|nr:PHP domain-containing protein [Planctomycetota bacterium]
MHDYKGCLHIHSTFSDGHAAVPEILDAARDAGLDYIVLTDHATLQARADGFGGWHDGVLLDVGAELDAGHHHCLALGLEDLDGVLRPGGTEATLNAIRQRGGLVFVVHPRPVHKPLFDVWVPGWTDWHLDAFHGLEIWPYMHDWIRRLHPWNLLSHCRRPERWVEGPDRDILGHWDAVGRRRRVVGIGSLDNHAKRVPFRRWGLALLEVLPHGYVFRTVRTHVVSPQPFCGEAAADLRLLHGLLAQGRCYVSYDLLADATGFRFEGRRAGDVLQMGDEAPAGEPVELRATCPAEADLRLMRDGTPVAAARGRELVATAPGPGVYRVEAFLDSRPWVFSNPIYLR